MKFSIITVNYNNGIGLHKTIESVAKQTFKDYEHIIIDGQSTDDSKEIILRNKDYFSYWCSEPDKGIYNAMNKGITHAYGDYFLFLNSGDVLHDDAVLRCLSKLNTDADIIVGLVKRMDNGEYQFKHSGSMVAQLIKHSISHQGTLIKKSLFDTRQYNESLSIVADWQFFLETILIDNRTFYRTDIIVADMDMSGISNNPNYSSRLLQERDIVLQNHFPPLVLQGLVDYSKVYYHPLYVHLTDIKEHHSFIFLVIRRCIQLIYFMLKVFR